MKTICGFGSVALLMAAAFVVECRAEQVCVYVSDAGTQAIVLYHLDEATGKLKEVSRTNVGTAPGSLAVNADKRLLLASLRTNAEVGSFKIAADVPPAMPAGVQYDCSRCSQRG